MKKFSFSNVFKAAFNTANLAGLGAVALSRGIGSTLGTALFGLAVVIGSVNKYRALTREPSGGALGKFLRDPSITMKILMAASALNGLEAAAHIFTQGPDARLRGAFSAACWFLGVWGDNTVRKLDKVNFRARVAEQKKKPHLHTVFAAAGANPGVAYSLSGLALMGVMLGDTHGPADLAVAGGVIALYTVGITHAIRRTAQALEGKIPLEKINDGLLNFANAGGLASLGVLALAGRHYWIAASQFIFSAAAVKSLYETRSALKKTGHRPSVP